MTIPTEGPIPGQGGVPQPLANGALTAFDTAYEAADSELQNAGTNLNAAIQAYGNIGPAPSGKEGYDPYAPGNASAAATYDAQVRALEGRIQSAQTAYNSALSNRQRAADQRAAAYATAAQKADPASQAALIAQADKAKTDAAKADAELKEWKATADDRKAEVAAKQRLQNAQASVAETQAAYDKETQPQKKALLEADLKAKQAALVTANADAQVAGQLAGLRVQKGAADVAQTQAQTGLVGAQTGEANAATARSTGLLPGEIAQQGATLAGTQAATDTANALRPGQVAQQGAALAQTSAQTAQTLAQTNPLLAKINEITQAFREGKLDALPNPQQFITDAIAAAGAGTTPFDIFNKQQAEQTQRLGQQVTQRDVESRLLGLKAGAFGQATASEFGTLAGMNKDAPPGSNAGAAAFMFMHQQGLQDFGGQNGFNLPPPVEIPNAPSFYDQYRTPAAPQAPAPAAPPPAQPAPAVPPADTGTGHTINITIGGSGGGESTPQPFTQSDLPEGSNRGVTPSYLQNQQAPPDPVAAVHSMYPDASARYQQRQGAGMVM